MKITTTCTPAFHVLSALLLLGAAPSRDNTYVAGQIIDPSKVTANEDAIFSYLQAGVDTYRTSSINAAALANASVEANEIATGAVTTTGILDGTIANADVSSSAAIGYSKLSTMSGDATITDGGALTIAANSVALTTDTTGNYVATLVDAGNTTITVVNGSGEGLAATVDAVDVNCNNCIDGTDIALGADAQGDVMYYNGTDWVRLGAGTSGQFLKTNGAGANPAWAASPSYFCTNDINPAANGTQFYMWSLESATENQISSVIPATGTLRNLRARITTRSAGVNKPVTVMVNGAATAITVTVAADATLYSDTSNTAAVTVGDVLSFRVTDTNTADVGYKFCVQLDE